jgi:hypothetical protein
MRISSGISTKMSTTPVTLQLSVNVFRCGKDKQIMEKMMRREAWKMFAIPRAMQTIVSRYSQMTEERIRKMDSTPSHWA